MATGHDRGARFEIKRLRKQKTVIRRFLEGSVSLPNDRLTGKRKNVLGRLEGENGGRGQN